MSSASTLKIAWRNLGRNRKRTALAVGAIALGQLTFLVNSGIMRGYGEDFFTSITGPMVGHIQVHAREWREERSVDLLLNHVESTIAEILADPQVDHAAPRVYAPVLAALSEEGFMSMVVGIDVARESHPSGLLEVEGNAPRLGERRVFVGRGLALKYDIEPGMEIAVVGQDVDGSIANDLFVVVDVIASPVAIVDQVGIVMTLEDAQILLGMGDEAHEIVIHTKDRSRLNETVARLSSLPLLEGAEVLSWRDIVPQMAGMIEVMGGMTLFILAIVFVAAAAGIANTMMMSTFERRHEFGMLLSLGCRPWRLSRMVVVEALLLGFVGVGLGTALGVGFILATGDSGLDYAALGGAASTYEVNFQGLQMSSMVYPRVHLGDVMAGVVAVLLTSFVSTVWPMIHISRLEPREAMRP